MLPTRTPRRNKRRKPIGKPIPRTDADLDRLSTVTAADVEAARVLVAGASPAAGKLLDAKQVEDETQPV